MKLPKLALTDWAILACIGMIAFVGLGLARPSFLGFTFDPFGMNARALKNATARADYAESDASARGLEAEGERDQAQRVETFSRVLIETQALTTQAITEARSAPDANEPLPAERADRLRRVDDGLCVVSPAICAPSPTEPPARRDDAL